MSTFLFVVPPFFGHISPTLSLGASLLAKNHQVIWVGIQPIPEDRIPEGGQFIVPHDDLKGYEDEIERILKRQDDGPGVSVIEALKIGLEETYVPFARFMMKGLLKIIDTFQPDVIVNDCLAFAGSLGAHIKGIPCATTTPVPPDVVSDEKTNPSKDTWHGKLIFGLQKEFGITSNHYEIQSHELNIVFTSEAFANIPQPSPSLKFVGPVKGRPNEVPFDWDRLRSSQLPKVYITIGTLLVDIRKEYFTKMIEAFGDQPVTVVAATDPAVIDEWPENFIVQGFVPQSEVMANVDAVICHGGFNTVNDTFWNGLPMVITPIAYDQFHTASLIEHAGCGIKLRYKRLRVSDLRNALFEVLENETYREAAEQIRETFERAGGVEQAVEYLEEMASVSEELSE
ncbi:MAG: nucleotide disphospho-sugar-binding domain-containing protein [Bacteroidota bacterium]